MTQSINKKINYSKERLTDLIGVLNTAASPATLNATNSPRSCSLDATGVSSGQEVASTDGRLSTRKSIAQASLLPSQVAIREVKEIPERYILVGGMIRRFFRRCCRRKFQWKRQVKWVIKEYASVAGWPDLSFHCLVLFVSSIHSFLRAVQRKFFVRSNERFLSACLSIKLFKRTKYIRIDDATYKLSCHSWSWPWRKPDSWSFEKRTQYN